jgi:hypothetical protein
MKSYIPFILLLLSFNTLALSEKTLFKDGSNASLTFEKYPELYRLEKMLLQTNLMKADFHLKLFHPEMNYYSMDPTVQSRNGQLLIENIFFIAEGDWELQFLALNGDHLGEFNFNLTKEVDETKRTHTIKSNEVYRGLEYYNGKATNQVCYISIEKVIINKKGHHCYDVKYQFMSNRTDTPKGLLNVSSRITNYHRVEYPRIKTCAKNIDGTTDGPDIYAENPEQLVNDIFNGMIKKERTEYHTFLSIDKLDKTLYQARIHGLRWNKEWDVDCLGLKKIN